MAKRARQSCNLISGTVQGYYAAADGSINSSDTHWCRSELISCEGSTSYVCTATIAKMSRWVAASFYDIDMNYLGSVDTKPDPPIANVALSFTTPATAAYMGLSFAATYYYTTLTPSEITNLMLNEGPVALPYEPYGIIGFYEPCAVKRYTSREEMNASIWQKTYKGNTLLKKGADIAFSINTGGGYGASVSTDQFYKDNCAIKLAANETYSIKVTNNIDVGAAKVVVRYLSTNEIITSVAYGDLPEDITLTPNVETYIYFGVDISTGVSAREEKAMINVIRQAAWHDIDNYVRQSGAWVQQ